MRSRYSRTSKRESRQSRTCYPQTDRFCPYIISDLEKAVEELSQMLEEDVEAETVKNLRQRMVDKTVSSS